MKYTVLRVFTTFSLSKDEEICICVNYFNYRDIFIIMTFNKAETLRLVFLFLFSHFVPISKFQVLFITHPHYREQNAYQAKYQPLVAQVQEFDCVLIPVIKDLETHPMLMILH